MDLKFTVLINKETRDYYNISSPYNAELVENIKKLEKKEWNGDKKVWILDPYNLYTLISFYKGRNDFFFEFADKVEREVFVNKYKKAKEKRDKKEAEKSLIKQKQEAAIELKTRLLAQEVIDFDYTKFLNEGIIPWKYQIVGALFGNLLGSCLLAADMGTGKTLISILTCEITDDIKKILIIVPNSLKFNWGREIQKFTKQKFYIMNEKSKKANIYTPEESKYFIVNYEYFSNANFSFKEKIEKYGIGTPDCLICDESHKLKNTKSNTTKNIQKHFKNDDLKHVFMLTGTPVPNRLEELYVQLNFLLPNEFTSKSKFYENYCGMVYNPYSFSGWEHAEEPKLDEMHEKLKGVMYRVKKKDVLKDLPDVQINKIYLKLTGKEEEEYNKIEQGFKLINWDNPNLINNSQELEQGDTSTLGIFTKLRQYTSIRKIEFIKEFLTDLNDQGEKVVIFDCFVDPLKELNKLFPDNSVVYYGGVPPIIRQDYVDWFQDEKNPLKNLFITTQTGNFGLTLTQASNMIALNQSFVPAENEQTIARLHRIGQKNNVNVFIFIFEDTIDEYVDKLIADKLKMINKVVDGEEYKDVSNKSIIGDLMKLYKKKYK